MLKQSISLSHRPKLPRDRLLRSAAVAFLICFAFTVLLVLLTVYEILAAHKVPSH